MASRLCHTRCKSFFPETADLLTPWFWMGLSLKPSLLDSDLLGNLGWVVDFGGCILLALVPELLAATSADLSAPFPTLGTSPALMSLVKFALLSF